MNSENEDIERPRRFYFACLLAGRGYHQRQYSLLIGKLSSRNPIEHRDVGFPSATDRTDWTVSITAHPSLEQDREMVRKAGGNWKDERLTAEDTILDDHNDGLACCEFDS